MRQPHIRRIEDLLCVALLTALPAAIVLYGAIRGVLPMAVDSVFFDPPWEEARPVGFDDTATAYDRLEAKRFYPWQRFLHHAAMNDQSVLWNPQEGYGAPFMALWRTRALSPFNLPLYWFSSFARALRWSMLLKLIVAGWCAYYVGRRFGLHAAGALCMAAAYQLSGPVFLWTAMPMSDVLPWFPMLALNAERLMLGHVHAWPGTAITIALMLLGGDPESVAAVMLFILLYMLARRLRDRGWTHLPKALLGLLIGAVFGAGLCAVQLFPFFEFLRYGSLGAALPEGPLRLMDAVALVAPNAIRTVRGDAGPVVSLLHVGLIQTLLIPLWFALRPFVFNALRRRMEALFMASLAMLAVPFLAGSWWGMIPGLRLLRPEHFLITHSFSLAFMAAAAAEEWNELNPEECKAALARLLFLVPVMWGALLLIATAPGFAGVFSWKMVMVHWLALALCGVLLLALLGRTLLRPNLRLTGYTLAAMTACALLVAQGSGLSRTASARVFPETSFVESLKGMQARVTGSRSLAAWPLAGNGIEQAFTPSGVTLDRYAAFIERAKEAPLLLRLTGDQAVLLTKEDIQGAFASLRPVLNIQQVFHTGAIIFRDLDAHPRARMIYAGRRVDQFNPDNLHVEGPPLLEGVSLPAQDNGPAAPVVIQQPESNTRIVLRIADTRPGVLVLADAWYPGWRALVDGHPAPVFPVDGIFRGVELGKGAHEVVLSYEPVSRRWGVYISLAAACCVLLGGYRAMKRRRENLDPFT